MTNAYFIKLLPWRVIKRCVGLFMLVSILGFSDTCLAAINVNIPNDNKAEFVNRMEQLREAINSGPDDNVIKFKVLVEEQIDNTLNNVEGFFLGSNKSEYIYDMMSLKKRIYDNPKLNIPQAKKIINSGISAGLEKYKMLINENNKEKNVLSNTENKTSDLINKQDEKKEKLVNGYKINENKIDNKMNSAEPKGWNKEKIAKLTEDIQKILAELENIPGNNIIKFKVEVNSGAETILDQLKEINRDKKDDKLIELSNEIFATKNNIYSDRKLEVLSAKSNLKKLYVQIIDDLVAMIRNDKNIAFATKPNNDTLDKIIVDNNVGGADAKPSSYLLSEKIESLINEINAVPNNNIIKFKVTIENETETFLTDVKPLFASESMAALDKEMNEIKNKIYNSKKIKIETAKKELINDYRKIENNYGPKVIASPNKSQTSYLSKTNTTNENAPGNSTSVSPNSSTGASLRQSTRATRNMTNSTIGGTDAQGNYLPANTAPKRVIKPVTQEVYSDLLKQVMTVKDQSQSNGTKVRISGGIRLHYAVNSGNGSWARNSSGIRADLAAETQLDKDWRLFAGLSAKKSFLNYDDKIDYRLYLMKKIGSANFRIGSFGYFMADGNIYDDSFDGVRFDFGESIRYSFSYGNTKYSKDTLVATARYDDYDYSIEAGAYLFKKNDDNAQSKILTLGGVYKFSNFNLGAMALVANRKDLNGTNFGYVYSLNYGELKSWRKGTYNIWAKYYYQPQYTYIAPSMNGRGGWMQGFRGVGVGINYTFSENLVGSLEYYSLTDLMTGAPGNTWWGSLTHFF